MTHFTDHKLQMLQIFRLISLWDLRIVPLCANSGDKLRLAYIHAPFDHAVLIRKHFETSSLISEPASVCIYFLVSILCSGHVFMKQLKLM